MSLVTSHKEQLALCLRYVDKLGRPCENFLGVVHVDDTTSLSLKEAIEALLVSHGLSTLQHMWASMTKTSRCRIYSW